VGAIRLFLRKVLSGTSWYLAFVGEKEKRLDTVTKEVQHIFIFLVNRIYCSSFFGQLRR
jgi:hypothetical protein